MPLTLFSLDEVFEAFQELAEASDAILPGVIGDLLDGATPGMRAPIQRFVTAVERARVVLLAERRRD